MNIIKLNAIPSTNTFLKELSATENLENFTTVVTEFQTKGKGQRGNIWHVEEGKNLTFSTLIKDFSLLKFNPFLLNILVSVSIVQVLEKYDLRNLKIKWPNDILAENKKIGGILIENTFKKTNFIEAVIGIGLNVNQSDFDNLPKASSIFLLSGQFKNKEELLEKIILQLKNNYQSLLDGLNNEDFFWDIYHQFLFRKDIPSVFQDVMGLKFQGIITKVNEEGKLEVLLEDDSIQSFEVKEVALLY